MHSEYAIGRFLPGDFTLACRVTTTVRASHRIFVVLVLSEAVLSATVLVLDGGLNCGDAAR